VKREEWKVRKVDVARKRGRKRSQECRDLYSRDKTPPIVKANVLSQFMIASRSREMSTKPACWRKRRGGGKAEVKGEITFLFPSCLCLLKKVMYFQTACL